MDIKKSVNEGEMTIKVVGRLETMTAPLLDAEVKALPPELTSLVLDFTDLEYVSSAGLRVVLTAQKAMNARKAKMTLVGVNAVVKHVFDITGFSPVLTFA